MKSIIRKAMDNFQAVGFVISAILSIILLVAKQDTVTSLVFGLVSATIFQMFELQKRLDTSEERMLQSSALSQKLYRDEWLLKHVGQIVSDYETVRNGWFDIFKDGAQDRVTQCRNDLHSMAEGRVVFRLRSRFSIVATGYYQVAKQSLKGVTSGDLGFWRKTHVTKFLQGNAELAKRGVKITRVFIQPAAKLREAAEIAKKHRDLGIDVYVVAVEDLPRALNEDYLIVDDKIFSRRELTGDGQAREEMVSVDEVEVNEKARRFDMLLQYAERLDDFLNKVEA